MRDTSPTAVTPSPNAASAPSPCLRRGRSNARAAVARTLPSRPARERLDPGMRQNDAPCRRYALRSSDRSCTSAVFAMQAHVSTFRAFPFSVASSPNVSAGPVCRPRTSSNQANARITNPQSPNPRSPTGDPCNSQRSGRPASIAIPKCCAGTRSCWPPSMGRLQRRMRAAAHAARSPPSSALRAASPHWPRDWPPRR